MGHKSNQQGPGGYAPAATAPISSVRPNLLQGLFGDRLGSAVVRLSIRTIPPRIFA